MKEEKKGAYLQFGIYYRTQYMSVTQALSFCVPITVCTHLAFTNTFLAFIGFSLKSDLLWTHIKPTGSANVSYLYTEDNG